MSTLRVPLIKELPYAATGFRAMSRGDGLILVIDQGTTGTRAALVSHNGLIVSYAYSEHTQIYPKPGWVEHNPLEIWEKVMLVVKEVIEKSRVDPRRIVAIGVTNQRETTVIWDPRTGQPALQCRCLAG